MAQEVVRIGINGFGRIGEQLQGSGAPGKVPGQVPARPRPLLCPIGSSPPPLSLRRPTAASPVPTMRCCAGRLVMRAAYQHQGVEVVAINDPFGDAGERAGGQGGHAGGRAGSPTSCECIPTHTAALHDSYL